MQKTQEISLKLKPRPNDRNISTQHHDRNIVGRNMLHAFGHHVAMCCDILGDVGSNLKMIRFFTQHLWMMFDVVVVWPGSKGAFVWDQSGIRIIGKTRLSVSLGAILIPEYLDFHSGYYALRRKIAGIYFGMCSGIYSYSGIPNQRTLPSITE